MTDNLEELERRGNTPGLPLVGLARQELNSLIAKAREADELRAEVAANSAAAAKQISDLAMQVGELRARLDRLYGIILENDPDAPIADNGMTVWDGLRNEVRAALGEAK